MENVDATTIATMAQKAGLVTEAQLQEGWEEVGGRGGEPGPLLRVLERKGYLTPWHTSKLLKGETDGFFLGGYKLLYKIASGSFGRVWRGEDPQSGRVVAIKVLRRRWTDNPHQVELFEREGRVGLSLQHPNIVEILAVSRDAASQQYYIVMEFVEGSNLRDLLAIRKKMGPAEALHIVEDAAAGLSYAFSRGVTHRDMKLTNILVSSQGQAKLVDFGLSNLFAAAKAEGVKVDRTVDYAGLEKGTGVRTGDPRSDIYFLGCVLYQVLTGRPPLEVTRNAQLRMQRHRFFSVAPIRPDEVQGPPSLFHLVETMMALQPQQRFQTPSQLLDAIRTARQDVNGRTANRDPGTRSVFVVEKDERLLNAIRDKLKELGYKVFLASDPARALDRFRQQPYDALVLDAGTTGEDGLVVFDGVMVEAARSGRPCAGILILSEDQASWAERISARPQASVLVRPGVTLKQLHTKLQELVPVSAR